MTTTFDEPPRPGIVDQPITAGPGNVTLAGGAGNDTIVGGGGIDTVVYSGSLSRYTVTETSSGYTVTDTSGTDGTDTLLNIGRLKFSDKYVALDTNGDAGQAYRIYQAAFNRAPDEGGLGYWITSMDNGEAS
ncbi:MAG: hypothetical protein PHQ05_12775 [Sterolibacterium sp.]|nr:hypothetical protein [Sterolibacterium sp.]